MHELKDNLAEYVLGGNATITIKSGNMHLTYKIVKSEGTDTLYFVHLLRGPDNETDYSYIGCYFDDTHTFRPCKSYKYEQRRDWPLSLKLISHVFYNLYGKPSFKVYHEGKCARCGRKLTTPESIITGFGPECIKLIS